MNRYRPFTIIVGIVASLSGGALAYALTLPYEESLTAMDTEVTVRRNGPDDQTELELEHGGNVTTVYLSDVNRVRVAYMLEHAVP